jgi:predicted AAA+ superfamily ATPase
MCLLLSGFLVGKVNIMNLYPMTFDEFLLAMGKNSLVKTLQSYDKELIDILGETFTEMLRQYYFVGGMPEAVQSFAESKD